MESDQEIKKIIIPVAGLGTRFLPLSLVIPKEFFPLATKPIIHYIVQEAKQSGINEIIFVVNPKHQTALRYFKHFPELEKVLMKRKKEDAAKELQQFQESFEGMVFSYVIQKKPLGDGQAIAQAAKLLGVDPVAVSFCDDLIDSEEPAIFQLMNIFKTCKAPVIALKTLPREKIPSYGSVAVEKIANRLYKIKKIIEKPDLNQIKSDLVIVGKFILTPDVFSYLKKSSPSKKGEIILAETFDKMLNDGRPIYGYEIKGEWLECGDKEKWLKSFFYLSLKDPVFGKELKDYLKKIK